MFSTAMSEAVGASGARERVTGAIQLAAARTGVDFSYLLNQARIESGLDPNARARTSSATGLFQFIDQTWLGTVQRHGARHGLGWAADAIQRGANGRFHVADPAMRRAILDLRRQPEAASTMAAEFASDNRSYLEGRLDRDVEAVDLYLAHFLGAAGAARFLSAHDANPNASAAASLPAAARANRWVFFNRDGSARSFADIRAHFAEKIGNDTPARAPGTFVPGVRQDSAAVRMAALQAEPAERLAGPSPQYARLAYLMLAQLGA
jgi:hypothetical protein